MIIFRLFALLALCSGCVGIRGIPPLVPLAGERMPSVNDLEFKPWRVAVVVTPGTGQELEREFAAGLRAQLHRHGVEVISIGLESDQLLTEALKKQAASGEEVRINDPLYDIVSADGVVSVELGTPVVMKNNLELRWRTNEKESFVIYESEVQVNGHLTLTDPQRGSSRTVRFNESFGQRTFDKPHSFDGPAMALRAARRAAGVNTVSQLMMEEYPLVGYVIGAGTKPRLLKINRGSAQGVITGRKWQLVIEHQEENELVGRLAAEKIIGTATTVEVYRDFCVIECDSKKTRLQAKLGMKAKATSYGFNLGDAIWKWTQSLN